MLFVITSLENFNQLPRMHSNIIVALVNALVA